MTATSLDVSWTHLVGVDISKDVLDCWLHPQAEPSRWTNAPSGFDRLQRWMRRQGCSPDDTLVCMENTGIYGYRLLAALRAGGWPVAVVKTTATQKVAPEHHRKEDRYDARLLAEYADRYADHLTLAEAPDQAVEALRQLFCERHQLVKARAATKNRRCQSDHLLDCPQALAESWQSQLAFYDQQIQTMEARINQLVAGHPGLREYEQLLRSIPGVGKVTAWLWLILFYGQQTLNYKQVASRFGFAPHRYQSGSSVRGRTRSSGHGQARMRACMTMVARTVCTHTDRFAAYKKRKREEGKVWQVIRNNVINQMIKIMCAIWNTRQPWEQDHRSRYERQNLAA